MSTQRKKQQPTSGGKQMNVDPSQEPSTAPKPEAVIAAQDESVIPTLTDHFDHVFVINCAHRPDRLQEFWDEIESKKLADPKKITVFSAIIGDYTTHPAGFGGGRGAWGCLQSHRRIMEDLMHIRDDRGSMTWQRALILEDDVFFLDNALTDLKKFMSEVPMDWGQLYLGGQNRMPMKNTDWPHVRIGQSVNRTHAYAVNAKYIQKVYCHVSYMMDYNGNNYHIDHQLERAHQRGDWPVYCPPRWICGQRGGSSNVSGKQLQPMTWQ